VSLDKRYELIEHRTTVGRVAPKRGLVFWIRIKERFQLEAVSANSMVVDNVVEMFLWSELD